MSDEQGKAKLRVEIANKGEVKAFFAESGAAAKKAGADIGKGLETADKAVGKLGEDSRKAGAEIKRGMETASTAVTQFSTSTVDAAGKVRDSSGRFVAGQRSATQETERLAGSAARATSSVGSLASGAGRAARSSEGLASVLGGTLKGAVGHVTSSVAALARGLGALAGLGAGVGVVAEVKSVIELDDAIVGVAATAGLADDKIAGLKSQILETSVATQQFGGDLTEALGAFVAKTGDIDEARRNLKLYGDTAKATRSSVVEIANIGADLRKLGITDQGTAFAVLAKQADVGQVELKDLVSQGPRLLSAFMGAGLTGERGLREGGALAQVAQGATGNVERTSTSVESVFRDLVEKAPQLRGLGVKVFDDKTHLANNPVEVLLETIRKTGGRQDYLTKLFGAEAMRAVNPLATEYRKTGAFATYESFRDVNADPALMERKRQLNTSTAAAKIQALQIDVQAEAVRHLSGAVNDAAGHLGKFTDALRWAEAHPYATAGLAVGGYAGASLAKKGASAAWDWATKKFAGGVGAGALSGEGSPVHVTNWPAGFGAGGGAGAGGLPSGARNLELSDLAKPAAQGGIGAAVVPGIGASVLAGGTMAAAGLAYVGLADTLGEADTKQASNVMKDDFASGRKRRVQHWYTALGGGGTIEDVPPEEQAQAAKDYRAYQLANNPRQASGSFDMGGMSGAVGGAVAAATLGAAGGANQTAFEPTLNLTVNISGDEATIEANTGTRSPAVRVRRKHGGG